ncbi:MAG: hypothetical protein NVSMB27_48740 [Ktedonobacteraceae bacterium]
MCEPPKQQEPTEELIQDMLTIVTVFAAGCMAIEPKTCAKAWKAHGSECEQEEQTDGTGESHH